MTAVAPPVCTDTMLPGLTRRREWRAPAVRSHSAVAVSPAGLQLTGEAVTVIDLTTVRRVTLDLVANTLTLVTRPEVTVEFADAETADAVYTAVWRRLGSRFALSPRRPAWELARTPVAFMAGVLTATLALSLTANALADAGGPSGPLAAFAPADWRAVCGLGGAALAGLQVWLYRRITRPPHRLELTPQG